MEASEKALSANALRVINKFSHQTRVNFYVCRSTASYWRFDYVRCWESSFFYGGPLFLSFCRLPSDPCAVASDLYKLRLMLLSLNAKVGNECCHVYGFAG